MSSDDPTPRGAKPSPDGSEHDAWLREALRHAPDAGAAPPVSLRDAILAEARAATRVVTAPRVAPTPSLLDRLLEFWSWLARPQVAAGFASVMAATLVGMLWWDRPMDEAMAPPPSSAPVAATVAEPQKQAAAASPRVQQESAASAALPPTATTAPALRDKAATPSAKTAPPPAPTGTATAAMEEQAPRAELGRGTPAADERVAPSPARAQPPADALRDERKDRSNKLDAPQPDSMAPAPSAVAPSPFPARTPGDDDAPARRPAPAAPSVLPAPATAPAPQPLRAPVAGARAEPFALAKKAEPAEKEGAAAQSRAPAAAPMTREAATSESLGRSSVGTAEASASGRVSAQNQADAAPRQRAALAAAETARPMAPLLAALASEGSRWSRPLGRGESAAIDAAVQAWLAQVQAVATHWDPAAESTARRDSTTPSPAAPGTLLLDREGRPGAIVRIENGGVFFDFRSGATWFAPLPPEVVARLRVSLPAAVR